MLGSEDNAVNCRENGGSHMRCKSHLFRKDPVRDAQMPAPLLHSSMRARRSAGQRVPASAAPASAMPGMVYAHRAGLPAHAYASSVKIGASASRHGDSMPPRRLPSVFPS